MKKTLITLLIFSLCSLLTAQFVVWHNGEIIFQTDINNVDSITLYQLDSPGEEDNPPIDKNDFSLYFNGQEIKNNDVITVDINNYEWGELIAKLILVNNLETAQNFTLKEVRNYDYNTYIPSLCVSTCLMGNNAKEQLWNIGSIPASAQQEIAMHLRVNGNPSATCTTDVTLSNGNETVAFLVKFVYEDPNPEPKPEETKNPTYLYGNCTIDGMHDNSLGMSDGKEHIFSAASLLDMSDLTKHATEIIGIRAYIGDEVTNASVWAGTDFYNPTYTKQFTYKKGGWQYVLFDEPIAVQSSDEDIYIGYTVTSEKKVLAMEGTYEYYDSEWIAIDGEWMPLSDVAGGALWSIQAIVVGGDYSSYNQHDILVEKIDIPISINIGDNIVATCEIRNVGIQQTTQPIVVTYSTGYSSASTTIYDLLMNGQSIIVNLPELEIPNNSGVINIEFSVLEQNVSDDNQVNNNSIKDIRVYGESVPRNCVLIEQFTGQACGFCPGGASTITDAIKQLDNPNKVAWIAHHTFGTDDFTINESLEISDILEVYFAPACNIHRISCDYGLGKEELIWHPGYMTTNLLENKLNEPGLATLNLSSDYNTNTRELTLTVNGRSLEDEAYITVIITQNGIEAPQYGAPDNYQHNHAPRAFLTSATGDKLALDGNGNYSTTFNYTIPNKVGNFECIPENMEVIVFIHGDINKEINRIVYNADYKKLSELIK